MLGRSLHLHPSSMPSAPCRLLLDTPSWHLTGTPMKRPLFGIGDKVHSFIWSLVTKCDAPSVCFLVSSFLVLIWKEVFISQDLEPIHPSDKERRSQHTGQLHMQARNGQECAFLKQFGKIGPHLHKILPPTTNFQRSNQVIL